MGAAAAVLCLLQPGRGQAFSGGITGFSGRNQGPICNACHGSGTAPLVEFQGPNEVPVDTLATFRFVVRSQATAQTHAGLDVSASGGQLGTIQNQGARLSQGEITHNLPKQNAQGIAMWEFTWRAPNTAGTQTLFGAGNSVNRNGASSGDRASATTLSIQVIGPPTDTPTETPTPTPTPTPSPSPTLTATNTRRATRTPVPGTCPGDCSRNFVVTVDELIEVVNVAFGVVDLTDCPNADGDGNGFVLINDIVQAVGAAQSGCTP